MDARSPLPFVLGALVLLAGCAEAPPIEEDAALELGTGSWRFEPLEDGQEVELVRGAQGGWHVWISVRVRGMQGDPPPLRLTVEPADGSRPASTSEVQVPFDPPRDDGSRQLVGWTGIVDDPSCLVGELVRFTVEMPTDGGEVLRAERDVLVRGGAYPPPACE